MAEMRFSGQLLRDVFRPDLRQGVNEVILVSRRNKEAKISLRQRVRERNVCVLTSSYFSVIPGFLFGIVVVDDEMEAMSRSSLCVQKSYENDSNVFLSFSYSLSLS